MYMYIYIYAHIYAQIRTDTHSVHPSISNFFFGFPGAPRGGSDAAGSEGDFFGMFVATGGLLKLIVYCKIQLEKVGLIDNCRGKAWKSKNTRWIVIIFAILNDYLRGMLLLTDEIDEQMPFC